MISAGPFAARREDVRGQDILLVLDASGRPMLSIGSRSIETAHLAEPEPGGVSLAAATGSWFVPPPGPDLTIVPVLGPDGAEAARMLVGIGRARRIVLPSRTLTFTVSRLRPQYRVSGLYSATRESTPRPGAVPAPRAGRRTPAGGTVFVGEATPALVSGPDASLLFSLATLMTWRIVSAAETAEANRPT